MFCQIGIHVSLKVLSQGPNQAYELPPFCNPSTKVPFDCVLFYIEN